ncbi:MAG: D-alanyl-D-alanine carboxypeptidase/D-alanyl-D-alanine-endopeptidase [Prevotella sp.]|nr:D-alanyl-D-alanine carboxypeptidase/D-alanyl-D-alanine-endopeptidase [Prevotella sp.]
MKKILIIISYLCLVAGLKAQTEPQEVGNYKVAFVEPVDSLLLSPDSLLTPDAQSLPWPENVITRLDKLLDEPLLKRSQVGLMVYDLTADTIIFRYGERQTLRPASVMKLVTAITALDKLGTNYQFRTSLYYTGQLIGNVLNGDLYCVGGMDPRFNNDDMSSLADRIVGMGVDTIRGRIIGDYSMKDETRLGEGWCWDDDNPILSPLLVSKKADFLSDFVDELRNKGIVVDENYAEGTVPNGAYVVGSRFHAMDQILTRMLKESDNLYAESMFYQVAASGGIKHASAANARTHIKKLISKIGLNPDNYKIADGSGLSLYNYVSPELLVRLLRYAYRNSEIYSSLYPALPIAGEDGTLSKRMKGKYTAGNVRAKTGTLTGVSSLAGYCRTANNHLLAFCIINQGVMKNADGKAFQDAVCTALCQP